MKIPILVRRAMKRGLLPIVLVILALLILGAILTPWKEWLGQRDTNLFQQNHLKALEAELEQNALQYQMNVVKEMRDQGVVVAKADFTGRWADGSKIDSTGTFVTSQPFSSMELIFPIAANTWWRVINDSCYTPEGDQLYYVRSYDPADRLGSIVACFGLPLWFRGIVDEDLERYDQEMASETEKTKKQPTSQIQTTDSINFPSNVPSSYIYSCTKEPVTLGYVNPGDVFQIDPEMTSKYIIWDPSPAVPDGKVYGLGGTSRPASSCVNPQQFLAPNLNLGALLVYIPGKGWQLIDQPKIFFIEKPGKVVIAINDRKGHYKDNWGEINLKLNLTPANTQARVANLFRHFFYFLKMIK